MKIRIRYFALLRETVGREMESVEWEESPPTLEKLKGFLANRNSALGPLLEKSSVLCAVNQKYATGELVLKEGDEVAFLPPVSGG